MSVGFAIGGKGTKDASLQVLDNSTGKIVATAKTSAAVLGQNTLQVVVVLLLLLLLLLVLLLLLLPMLLCC